MLQMVWLVVWLEKILVMLKIVMLVQVLVLVETDLLEDFQDIDLVVAIRKIVIQWQTLQD